VAASSQRGRSRRGRVAKTPRSGRVTDSERPAASAAGHSAASRSRAATALFTGSVIVFMLLVGHNGLNNVCGYEM